MKKYIISLLIIICVTLSVNAQNAPPPTPHGGPGAPVGGGAPIGGGLIILSSLAIAYLARKTYINRRNNL